MFSFKNKVFPRFRSRELINKLNFSLELINSEVFEFLKLITKKDKVLDYSQLRIGLLHSLNEVLPPNSIVATTSYTIYDMINIIINSGNKPVFVDIDKNNLGPDISQLIDLVITKKVDCVIYTYLHGYNCDISKLAEICKLHNCILIEDCAQSLWGVKSDNCPGSYGDIALFSTGLFKNINTISGGLLCIDSKNKFAKDLIISHKLLKSNLTKEFFKRSLYALFFKFITSKIIFPFLTFPILKFGYLNNLEFINKRAREENNPKYIYRDLNSLLRMNIIQKALLMMKTKNSIKKDFLKKSVIAEIYLINLKSLLDIGILEIPGYKPFSSPSRYLKISSCNQIPILTNNRQKLLKFLMKYDVDIAAQHIRNLSNTKIYKKFAIMPSKKTEEISKEIILLPCYPGYPINKVKKLTKLINIFYKKI